MKNMKKILSLLPVIFLLCTLYGCSEGHKATEEITIVPPTEENLNKGGPEGVVGDALSVVSVSPTADSTGNAVVTKITAIFNRPLDSATVTNASFTLNRADGMSVNGAVSYDDASKTVTFTPQFPLLNQVQYKTMLTTDIKASDTATVTAAASLASNYTWQFTTISRPFLYVSNRAFDGSDAPEPSWQDNIWSLNLSDGSTNHLTTLVNSWAIYPTWSPDGTKIFFTSNRALTDTPIPGSNIWVMNADGSDLKPLEKPSAALIAALSGYQRLSPDGSKIAFLSNRPLTGVGQLNPVYNIGLMNTDGSSLKALTQYRTVRISEYDLEWSPDGSKIAFMSNGDLYGADQPISSSGCGNVWVVGLDGSSPKALTNINIKNAYSESLQWSPDGSMIAYRSYRPLEAASTTTNPVSNIWIVKNDGSEAKPKTSNTTQGIYNLAPLWSPDGSNILYLSSADLTEEKVGKMNIWVVGTADGAKPKALTGNTRNYNFVDIRWSQDGSKIFFVSDQPFDGTTNPLDAQNIWMMNADGSGLTPLTKMTNETYMEYMFLKDW